MRKSLLLATLIAMGTPTAQAQIQIDMSNMLRSLSGALRGQETQPQKQVNVTPVMGVRGIDETGQEAAAIPAGEDYVLMEGWAATRPEATAAATGRGLSARTVDFKDASESSGTKP